MTMLEAFLKDLAPLVNLDCGTSNTAGVTRAAEIMKAHYESIGFTCELVDLGPTVGKGLLARNKPEAGYYDVMMNAHLDTVFPDGTAAARPLSVDGDRAHGPGCSDCKGGVLAVFYAIKNARKEDLDRLSICVAYNPDEETGSVASTEWLASHGKHAKNVLIFEAARAGGELVRSRKGVGNFTVTFKGKSAHAGNNPWDGRNANVAAMKFALAAYELADAELGTTVNPGVLKGGSAPNVISDTCEVQLDIRYWKDEDGRALKTKIEELVGKTWVEGVTQTMRVDCMGPAMPLSEDTKELVAKITEAAKLEGFDAQWVDAGGGSDGNHIAKEGVPVIDGCAPAGGAFHSDREFLRLDTVEERIRMVTRFLTLI